MMQESSKSQRGTGVIHSDKKVRVRMQIQAHPTEKYTTWAWNDQTDIANE